MCQGFAFANQLTTQGSLRFEIPPGFVPGTKIGYYLQPALGIELRVQLWGCQTNESQREFLMSDQFPFKVPEGVERTYLKKEERDLSGEPFWVIGVTETSEWFHLEQLSGYRLLCGQAAEVEAWTAGSRDKLEEIVVGVASSLQFVGDCFEYETKEGFLSAVHEAKQSGRYFPRGLILPDGRGGEFYSWILNALEEPPIFAEGWDEVYRISSAWAHDQWTLLYGLRGGEAVIRFKHNREFPGPPSRIEDRTLPRTVDQFRGDVDRLLEELSFWSRPYPVQVGLPITTKFDRSYWAMEGARGDGYQLLTDVNAGQGGVAAAVHWVESLVGHEIEMIAP